MQLIETYFLWFVFYSFLGWVYETVLTSWREKRFVNRGFLNGFYTPIYGVGALLNLFLLKGIESPVILFLSAAILAGLLEFFTSWSMEKLFHARWWDYSNRRFNIEGRVFLGGLIIFASFSLVQLKLIQPTLTLITALIPDVFLSITAISLFALMLTDTIYTVTKFSKFDYVICNIEDLFEEARESIKSFYEKTSFNYVDELKKINSQVCRMVKAFPDLESVQHKEKLIMLRELVGYQEDDDRKS